MIFVVVLNWCGAADTIACVRSLLELKGSDFQIIICDNGSPDYSYESIRHWLILNQNKYEYLQCNPLRELTREEAVTFQSNEQAGIFLVQVGENLGYSGGNNVGIKLALAYENTEFVWILNNDTEVDPHSLYHLLERSRERPDIGICGSKLVYHHDRKKIQGLGGIFNPWLATSVHYAINEDSLTPYQDEFVESKIDYIVGASLFVRAKLFRDIGLLEERYFLYFEEIDLTYRIRKKYAMGMATKSIIYHKEGGSTEGGKSILSDFYTLRNRLVFTWLNNRKYIVTVWLGLFVALFNRLWRREFSKAQNVLRIILGYRHF